MGQPENPGRRPERKIDSAYIKYHCHMLYEKPCNGASCLPRHELSDRVHIGELDIRRRMLEEFENSLIKSESIIGKDFIYSTALSCSSRIPNKTASYVGTSGNILQPRAPRRI
jgi:hypothetical protein